MWRYGHGHGAGAEFAADALVSTPSSAGKSAQLPTQQTESGHIWQSIHEVSTNRLDSRPHKPTLTHTHTHTSWEKKEVPPQACVLGQQWSSCHDITNYVWMWCWWWMFLRCVGWTALIVWSFEVVSCVMTRVFVCVVVTMTQYYFSLIDGGRHGLLLWAECVKTLLPVITEERRLVVCGDTDANRAVSGVSSAKLSPIPVPFLFFVEVAFDHWHVHARLVRQKGFDHTVSIHGIMSWKHKFLHLRVHASSSSSSSSSSFMLSMLSMIIDCCCWYSLPKSITVIYNAILTHRWVFSGPKGVLKIFITTPVQSSPVLNLWTCKFQFEEIDEAKTINANNMVVQSPHLITHPQHWWLCWEHLNASHSCWESQFRKCGLFAHEKTGLLCMLTAFQKKKASNSFLRTQQYTYVMSSSKKPSDSANTITHWNAANQPGDFTHHRQHNIT